ncbi:MAG: hypothetical protein JNL42_02075 [Anaerolineae bacterium]|nr:hypothetical protein [Anaerolineae bacterium]
MNGSVSAHTGAGFRTIAGGVTLAIFLLLLTALLTAPLGPLMGGRSVSFRPPVEVRSVEIGSETFSITLKNNAQYRLHAEYGFSLRDQQDALVFDSAPLDAGHIDPRQELTLNVSFPTGVEGSGWKVTAWARERVTYLEEAISDGSTLEEPRAIVRRAPMSIESVRFTRDAATQQTDLDVDLRLTGTTQNPVVVRYALSVIRAVESESGGITPVERVYLGEFVQMALIPGETRDLSEQIETTLTPGDYAITLWVQRQTESGAFEHFAQFTYPEMIVVGE